MWAFVGLLGVVIVAVLLVEIHVGAAAVFLPLLLGALVE